MAADFAELESLKQKGNKQYGAKNYTEALKLYDDALESIALTLPQIPSSLSAVVDNHSEFYREIAMNLEDPFVSSIDKQHRVAISKILLNRAACNLNLKQFDDCIHSANLSLLYDASNENALFRRGYALEKLSKTGHALQCYQRLLSMNPSNKKAQTACKRMQSLLTTKCSAKTKYTEFQRVTPFVPRMTLQQAFELQIGDKIDHRDAVGRFVFATVSEKHGTNLKIHYDGWSRKWDTWSDFRYFVDIKSYTMRFMLWILIIL